MKFSQKVLTHLPESFRLLIPNIGVCRPTQLFLFYGATLERECYAHSERTAKRKHESFYWTRRITAPECRGDFTSYHIECDVLASTLEPSIRYLCLFSSVACEFVQIVGKRLGREILPLVKPGNFFKHCYSKLKRLELNTCIFGDRLQCRWGFVYWWGWWWWCFVCCFVCFCVCFFRFFVFCFCFVFASLFFVSFVCV